MPEPKSVDENSVKYLICVGGINPAILNIDALQSDYPILSGVIVRHFSLSDFQQSEYLNLPGSVLPGSVLPDSVLPDSTLANSHDLAVIITDETTCFKKEDFKNSNLFVVALNEESYANVFIPSPFSLKNLISVVNTGFQFLFNNRLLVKFSENIVTVSRERKELSEIGIALSAERDLEKLLTRVLKEGRNLGNCEAASLYLLKRSEQGERELVFKLTQNSEIDFDFSEMTFPLTKGVACGVCSANWENIKHSRCLSTG